MNTARPSSDNNPLKKPVRFVKGVGEARAQKLKQLNIETVKDVLYHFPKRHEDRTKILSISDLKIDEKATIIAVVSKVSYSGRYRRIKVVKLKIEDNTGTAEAVWFNQPYLADKFKCGQTLILSGKVKFYNSIQLLSPAYEIISDFPSYQLNGEDLSNEFGKIIPIYPLVEGISHKQLRYIVREALSLCHGKIIDFIPPHILKKRKLPSIEDALKSIHFPQDMEEKEKALNRFKYEELFMLETILALRKEKFVKEQSFSFKMEKQLGQRIRRLFPFKFTKAQENVISEIVADLTSGHPTNRLLQGDVGSGKTAVAVYAILLAVANKYQAAFMAPTEILAEQHFRTISSYLSKSRVNLSLLTSSVQSERCRILEELSQGKIDIIVGTHALIEESVVFKKLGLIIVDEQHKFGVLQRLNLARKGKIPHIIVMTATPIPRTLSLTVFGDLDISVIDELPPGRKPVETRFVRKNKVAETYDFIRREISKGQQAYFVYPVIEDSMEKDLKGVITMYKHISKTVFPDIRVGLLHGQMKPQEKEKTMSDFRAGKIKILVATILIEVGVDVPNATIMVIEHCERFGLSQLHQLRGRIGRSEKQSFCFLLGSPNTEEAKSRISALLSTVDGFKIAEEDLKIRGPGEFFGTKQSGMPDLKIANIIDDYDILCLARSDSFDVVKKDPNLQLPENYNLRNTLIEHYGSRISLIGIG
ncbi:MAG: ATP-dependent DNA helicase RecG [Planctomycetota bacterium]